MRTNINAFRKKIHSEITKQELLIHLIMEHLALTNTEKYGINTKFLNVKEFFERCIHISIILKMASFFHINTFLCINIRS